MSDLFDDLEDFGAFDDVVSGNVRDPYPELARQRHETPIQRIDMSAMPGEEGKPVFIVYRTRTSSRCCATTRRSRRRA